jgi:membrane-associated phospholipid phosphatase
VLLIAALPARADGWLGWTEARPADALSLRSADLVIAPAALLLLGGSQLVHLAPAHCRLCDGADDSGLPGSAGAGRGSLNGVDAFFHDALTGTVLSRKTADTTSTVLAFGVTPAFALGAAWFATGPHASPGAGARAAVIVLESLAVSRVATEVLKLGFARKRPFVRYGTGTNGATASTGSTYDVNDDDSRLGFVSGHASAVAALGVSAAMCASLQDSQAAPALWTGASALVVLTGTLRMVAEKHYFTDVLAGAVVGAGTGVLLPLLHRQGVQVTPNGFSYVF